MKRRSARFALIAGLVLASLPALASAAVIDLSSPGSTVTLEALTDGNSVRVGDKVFSDFRYTPLSSGSAVVPSAGDVTVSGLTAAGPGADEIGLRFDGTWAAFDGGSLNATLAFKVVVDDPNLLSDNTLSLIGASATTGSVLVTENITSVDPAAGAVAAEDRLASKTAYYFESSGTVDAVLLDHRVFPKTAAEAWVVKDIKVSTFAPQSSATFAALTQTFSQVPEPGTLVLVGMGLLAVGLRRRRGLASILMVMALAGAGAVPAASAAIVADLEADSTYTLDQVNTAGGIEVGHLLFSDFQLASTIAGGLAEAPDANELGITGVAAGNAYGLRFNGNWSAFFGSSAETVLSYRVDVINASFTLSSVAVWMTANGTSGGGTVEIDKQADATLQGPSLLQLAVWNRGAGDVSESDAGALTPESQTLFVRDAIVVASSGIGSVGGLSEFYQTYEPTPEPGTLSLCVLAAAGVLLRRRRA